MAQNIVFLSPYLKPTIWGGHRLQKYNIKSQQKIGEAWLISAIHNYESTIRNTNIKLSDFFKKNKSFFNNSKFKQYPLLFKLLDCNQNLSIQTHPKDIKHQKNEAWYFLRTQPKQKIIFGHKAKTKQEFITCVHNKQWSKLLSQVSVRDGDIVNIPSGTLHALQKGSVVLEIQQPVDITYRLYDYDRELKDKTRKLHIKEVIKNITFPQTSFEINKSNCLKTKHYCLQIIENISNKCYNFQADWLQCFVIKGNGIINDIKIKTGDCFLLSKKFSTFNLSGKIKLVITYMPH